MSVISDRVRRVSWNPFFYSDYHEHTPFWLSRSAHLISRYRPRAPIIAVTRNEQTARQAHLYRGIFPVFYNNPSNDVWAEDVDLRVNFAMEVGKIEKKQMLLLFF